VQSLPYPRTPTSFHPTDLPSFFLVCQRVDRFIDTLTTGETGGFDCFDIRAVRDFIGLSKIAKPYKKN